MQKKFLIPIISAIFLMGIMQGILAINCEACSGEINCMEACDGNLTSLVSFGDFTPSYFNFTIEQGDNSVDYFIQLLTTSAEGETEYIYCFNGTGYQIFTSWVGSAFELFTFEGNLPENCIVNAKVSIEIGGSQAWNTDVHEVQLSLVPPPSRLEQNVIYTTMRGASAGLGRFIIVISEPLFILLVLLIFVAVVFVIAFSIKKALIEGATP